MRNLVIGSVLGALALTLAAAIAALLGDLDFSFTGSPAGEIVNSMLFSLVIFAVAAAFEEVLFRGYILQTFIRSDLKWFGVFFTAALFASVHNSNPNAGLISWVNTFIAGVWFGVAYLKTRDLWFVWGLHLFWNWMQGAVFGIEVSGLTEIITASVLKESDRGPEWLTGGNYGIEASIASTIALIVSTAVIYYLPFLRPSDEMMEVQKPAVQKPAP